MDITIYARAIDDISAVNHDSVSVSLEEVDLSQVVAEVGVFDLLEEIGTENIQTYLREKAELETDDN